MCVKEWEKKREDQWQGENNREEEVILIEIYVRISLRDCQDKKAAVARTGFFIAVCPS